MKVNCVGGMEGCAFQSFGGPTDDGEDPSDGGEVEEVEELGFEYLREGKDKREVRSDEGNREREGETNPSKKEGGRGEEEVEGIPGDEEKQNRVSSSE